MGSHDVVATVVPFVDDAVGVDQVVVADVAPAAAVGVEVPDGANDGRPVAAAVIGDGVVDDEMADGVVFEAVGVVAVGVGAPGVAADDERPGSVGDAFGQDALHLVELLLQVEQLVGRGAGGGVDEGQAQLAQGGCGV